MVSRWPPIVAVTVTVKGEPAIVMEGTVKLRTACGVPQLRLTPAAIRIDTTLKPRRGDTNAGIAGILLGTPRSFDLARGVAARPSEAHVNSEHGSIDINPIIRKLRLGQIEV